MYGIFWDSLVQPSWISRVVDSQAGDSWIQTHKGEIIQDPNSYWTLGADGGLRVNGRLVVSDVPQLKTELFDEAHRTRYTVHPSTSGHPKNVQGPEEELFGGRACRRCC